MVEHAEAVDEADEGGHHQRRDQERQQHVAMALPPAAAVDARGLEQLARDRLQRGQHDQEGERRPLQDLDRDHRGHHPPGAEQVRIEAEERQILRDQADELVEVEAVHDAHERGRDHHRQQEKSEQEPAARDQRLEGQRQEQAEQYFGPGGDQRKAQREAHRLPERRIGERCGIVLQPQPLRCPDGREGDFGEAVVEVGEEREAEQQDQEQDQRRQQQDALAAPREPEARRAAPQPISTARRVGDRHWSVVQVSGERQRKWCEPSSVVARLRLKGACRP
jgi:hypothetical protein